MENVYVKNGQGVDVLYNNVSQVVLKGEDGEDVTFNLTEGNEDIADLLSHDVSTKATAQISATEIAKIIPGNIRYGVTILGVEGTYSGGGGYTHSQSGSVLTADGFYSITQSSTELEVV